MKNKVLVLGHSGMLGHMVAKYLSENNFDVHCLSERWPTCKESILSFNGDYIVNCIGSIPQRTSDFEINWSIPIWLDLNCECKIIHPGTDCEIDLDNYGRSKNVAANFIKTLGTNTKILKCSVIGPELKTNSSLMNWFLSQDNEVLGYTEALWNGNTTLEWAKQCERLMNNWDLYEVETIIASETVTKYDLLHIFNKVFDKNIVIKPKNIGKDKSLRASIKTKDISEQLIELKRYYY